MKAVSQRVFTILGLVLASLAHGDGTNEYRVKAAFLVQFTKFVEWPSSAFADPLDPVVIGVIGTDPFGQVLDQFAARERVDGRQIAIRRLKHGQDFSRCHVVFIGKGDAAKALPTLRSVHSPVLTVGESPSFAKKGGMVNFYLQGQQIRFEINPDVARDANLAVSSRLLTLARIVRGVSR